MFETFLDVAFIVGIVTFVVVALALWLSPLVTSPPNHSTYPPPVVEDVGDTYYVPDPMVEPDRPLDDVTHSLADRS